MRLVLTLLWCLAAPALSAAVLFRVALPAPTDGSGDWRHLDETTARPLLLALTDGLVGFDPKTGLVAPGLASTWTADASGRIWTFTLKPATWSDGAPLTATDVVQAWKRSGVQTEVLEAPNAKTVRVVFSDPLVDVSVLATTRYLLFPDAKGRSCGPFVQDSSSPLVLIKNPRFREAKTIRIDRLEFRWVHSDWEAAALFRDKTVDWVPRGGGPGTWPGREQRHVVTAAGPGTIFLRFNLRQPRVGDAAYRRQLAAALDRKAIAQDLRGPLVFPSSVVLPAAAKVFGPLPEPALTLSYPQGETYRAVALEVAAEWKAKLGLDVTLQAVPASQLRAVRSSWTYEVMLSAWWDDYPSPRAFFEPFVSGGPENDFGWSNPAFDAAVERLRSALPGKPRTAALQDAWSALTADLPLVPLLQFGTENQINLSQWTGWWPNGTDIHPWQGVGRPKKP